MKFVPNVQLTNQVMLQKWVSQDNHVNSILKSNITLSNIYSRDIQLMARSKSRCNTILVLSIEKIGRMLNLNLTFSVKNVADDCYRGIFFSKNQNFVHPFPAFVYDFFVHDDTEDWLLLRCYLKIQCCCQKQKKKVFKFSLRAQADFQTVTKKSEKLCEVLLNEGN